MDACTDLWIDGYIQRTPDGYTIRYYYPCLGSLPVHSMTGLGWTGVIWDMRAPGMGCYNMMGNGRYIADGELPSVSLLYILHYLFPINRYLILGMSHQIVSSDVLLNHIISDGIQELK